MFDKFKQIKKLRDLQKSLGRERMDVVKKGRLREGSREAFGILRCAQNDRPMLPRVFLIC
jgi:hypothetical protein